MDHLSCVQRFSFVSNLVPRSDILNSNIEHFYYLTTTYAEKVHILKKLLRQCFDEQIIIFCEVNFQNLIFFYSSINFNYNIYLFLLCKLQNKRVAGDLAQCLKVHFWNNVNVKISLSTSNLSFIEREKAFNEFSIQEKNILVTTFCPVASTTIGLVINFHVPTKLNSENDTIRKFDSYVYEYRSSRTGFLGQHGTVISFLRPYSFEGFLETKYNAQLLQ